VSQFCRDCPHIRLHCPNAAEELPRCDYTESHRRKARSGQKQNGHAPRLCTEQADGTVKRGDDDDDPARYREQ
jgi:hypothetical protein